MPAISVDEIFTRCTEGNLPQKLFVPEGLLSKEEESKAKNSPCVLWEGATSRSSGHGMLLWRGKLRSVHRVVFEEMYKPIPNGLRVYRACGVKICVNPVHMYLHSQQSGKIYGARYGTQHSGMGSKLTRLQKEIAALFHLGYTEQETADSLHCVVPLVQNIYDQLRQKETHE